MNTVFWNALRLRTSILGAAMLVAALALFGCADSTIENDAQADAGVNAQDDTGVNHQDDADNDETTNDCGGDDQLEYDGKPAEPGEICGECGEGQLECDGDDDLECVGAQGLNSCGGCGALEGHVGDTCGPCDEGSLSCSDDGSELECEGALDDGDCPDAECDPDADEFGGGAGTSDDPYLICEPEDLNEIGTDSDYLDDHFRLMNDLDMADDSDEFTMIGEPGFSSGFEGQFDGQGRTIENFTIDASATDGVGLFRGIHADGSVTDLDLENVDITGASQVGALAGTQRGDVTGATVSGQVDATGDDVGGLIGNSWGDITDCHSTASVQTSGTDVGGLVGDHDDNAISDSSASGSVQGTSNVGGLAGGAYEIADSHAEGPVTSTGEGDNVGGLAGFAVTVRDSHATGDVDGGLEGAGEATYGDVGGLVGTANVLVENSYATGDVTNQSGNRVGGLVGNSGADIEDSWATGEVDAGDASTVGGLVGHGNASIWRSWAAGDVSADGRGVGGLVGGLVTDLSITDSYALGDVHAGDDWAGGLVGRFLSDTQITDSYAAGHVTANGSNIGGLVGYDDFSPGDATDSYWDEDTGLPSGQDTTGYGTPLSTSDFGNDSTFSAWDFDSVWEMGTADDGHERPVLQ